MGALVADPPTGRDLLQQLGRPRFVLAPMVDQSELPFRLLARRYGAQLCFTPMLNAGQFVRCPAAQREEALGEPLPEDRPLVVQLAGHDPDLLLQAARLVEHRCDAVDLNLGCPQGIARRGRYGAYLLEEEDLVVSLVRSLSTALSVPVTCKIRLFRDDLPRTVRLCRRLQEAGCAMLTVHGRTRFQNKEAVGACNWEAIATIGKAVAIPVVSNGGVETHADLLRCLEATGAAGVMSSEAALENPALFCNNVDSSGAYVDQDRLAREYLDLAERYLPGAHSDDCPKCVKAHIFKFLFAGLQDNHDLRERVSCARSLRDYRAAAEELAFRGWRQPRHNAGPDLYRPERSWYLRHRLRPEEDSRGTDGGHEGPRAGARAKALEEEDDAPWQPPCLFD